MIEFIERRLTETFVTRRADVQASSKIFADTAACRRDRAAARREFLIDRNRAGIKRAFQHVAAIIFPIIKSQSGSDEKTINTARPLGVNSAHKTAAARKPVRVKSA